MASYDAKPKVASLQLLACVSSFGIIAWVWLGLDGVKVKQSYKIKLAPKAFLDGKSLARRKSRKAV